MEGAGALRDAMTSGESIRAENLTTLVFDAFPSFFEVWAKPDLGVFAGSLTLHRFLTGFAIHSAHVLFHREHREFLRVLEFVERVHVAGTPGAADKIVFYYLEGLAMALNGYGLDLAWVESRAGPRTRESIQLLRATNLWEGLALREEFGVKLS